MSSGRTSTAGRVRTDKFGSHNVPDWQDYGSSFDQMRQALGRCRFGTAPWDKRFARSIAEMDLRLITDTQRWHVIRLARRYRRQLPATLVPSKDAFEAIEATRLARA